MYFGRWSGSRSSSDSQEDIYIVWVNEQLHLYSVRRAVLEELQQLGRVGVEGLDHDEDWVWAGGVPWQSTI